MRQLDLFASLPLHEGADLEFKSAKGGLPGSLWETYSAMANSGGGSIVLGAEHKDGRYVFSGVPDIEKTKSDFWNTVNNRGKVSRNLLTDDSVRELTVERARILVISVPRASRRERPIFIGPNPFGGTHRRNFEGDYRCTDDEVRRMFADQADESGDTRVLEHFGLADADPDTLRQYRQRFSTTAPEHPWIPLGDVEFLSKLGAWRKDRISGQEGLTVAGLLMFGRDEALRAPETGLPGYHLDYREKLSADPEVRWTDRVTLDGTWHGNLFQFYQRVIGRLNADLKIPFQLDADLQRRDDTIVHKALREAVVNSMIHADYRGQGGIVIEKYADRLEFSNPGSLLLSHEQILRGGVSECRNKALQTMFQLIGRGEKAGSGIDTIRQGWRSQHWRSPSLRESTQPDRAVLILPMVSMLPAESLARLRARFGGEFERLSEVEAQVLVTADVEGEVSNLRMQEMAATHSAELTKVLQGLVRRGLLTPAGLGRGTRYRVAEVSTRPSGSTHKAGSSSHKGGDSLHKPGDSSHSAEPGAHADWEHLMRIAGPARDSKRLNPVEMESIILGLCAVRFMTVTDLAVLLQRNPDGLRNRYLSKLVGNGALELLYPDSPNQPDQAYRAVAL